MEKCHARQLQTLFIQELCPTQFQKNTRWLSVYSTMRSLRVKEQSVWGKVAGHLQQRPPGAEQRSAERSAARAGDLRTAQGSMFRPHKPGSEYIAQPPRDMGVPPWQVVQAPVWAPPLLTPGPSWQLPPYLQLPPAHPKEEPRDPLCCPAGPWRETPPSWDTPESAVPSYSSVPFRVSIHTPTNHFLTTRASSHHTPLRSCLE